MAVKKRSYINFEDYKKKLFKDPEVRKACDIAFLQVVIAHQIITLREKKKMTQADLAKKIGSKQQVISRLESSRHTPSIALLLRIASVFNKKLVISFV